MEYIPNLSEANEPEQTGESKTSKKSRKKTTRLPKILEKTEVVDTASEKTKQKKDKKQTKAKIADKQPAVSEEKPAEPLDVEAKPETEEVTSIESDAEAESADAEQNTTQELEIPDVEAVAEPSGYQGELQIDHTEEPPRVAPPFPFVINTPPRPSERPAAPEVLADNPQPVQPERVAEQMIEPENFAVLPPPPEQVIILNSTPESQQAYSTLMPEADTKVITEKEASRREYRAQKIGTSRGVAAGGVVGWWAGRRGKRAAERETEIALENHDRIINRLSEEQSREREDHQKQTNIFKRAQVEIKELRNRLEDREAARAKPLVEARPSKVPNQESVPARSFAEKTLEIPAIKNPEQLGRAPRPELSPEDTPITEASYLVPESSRVETSAWHRIEIDKKTGQVVEQPSVEYGEAFKREQKQEKLAQDATAAQAASGVGMTDVMTGGTGSDYSASNSSISRSQSLNTSVQSVRRETVNAARQIAQNTTRPLIWAAGLVVVVLLYAVGIIN